MGERDYSSMQKQERDRAWVLGKIATAQTKKMYGEIVLKLEGGNIRLVDVKESMRPPGEKI